jgi:hypothetical protein
MFDEKQTSKQLKNDVCLKTLKKLNYYFILSISEKKGKVDA